MILRLLRLHIIKLKIFLSSYNVLLIILLWANDLVGLRLLLEAICLSFNRLADSHHHNHDHLIVGECFYFVSAAERSFEYVYYAFIVEIRERYREGGEIIAHPLVHNLLPLFLSSKLVVLFSDGIIK